MNFRRQPFQFTAIDPAKRQAELQKRFGLPSEDMYVDFANPGIMGAGSKESASACGSPRLQHRVPLFTHGFDQAKPERSQNVDTEHKPRIRNIPIEVEGADGSSRRHRTFSGPAGSANDFNHSDLSMPTPPFAGPTSPFVSPTSPFTMRKSPTVCKTNGESAARPKVCNIPIQIETAPGVKKVLRSPEPESKKVKVKSAKTNGCAASKPSVEKKPEPAVEESSELKEEKPAEPDPSVPLKQIEDVLTKLKTYHEEVEQFTGTNKDKKYRYLDEMLTRCMLDLDNVDTLGLAEVRQSRKAAVRQVQASIDLLETKINAQTSGAENTSVPNTSENNTDVEMKESAAETQNESTPAEGENTMEATDTVSQAMETETVADQPADSVTVTEESNVAAEDTIEKSVSEMEVEKPEEPSVIVEEMNDSMSETESNQAGSPDATSPVHHPVEMEASDTQMEEDSNSVQPVVTEPDEPMESAVVDTEIKELEQSAVDNCDTVVTEVKELDEPTTVGNDTVVTEVTEISPENQSESVNCVPASVEEANEMQTVSTKQCDSDIPS